MAEDTEVPQMKSSEEPPAAKVAATQTQNVEERAAKSPDVVPQRHLMKQDGLDSQRPRTKKI